MTTQRVAMQRCSTSCSTSGTSEGTHMDVGALSLTPPPLESSASLSPFQNPRIHCYSCHSAGGVRLSGRAPLPHGVYGGCNYAAVLCGCNCAALEPSTGQKKWHRVRGTRSTYWNLELGTGAGGENTQCEVSLPRSPPLSLSRSGQQRCVAAHLGRHGHRGERRRTRGGGNHPDVRKKPYRLLRPFPE